MTQEQRRVCDVLRDSLRGHDEAAIANLQAAEVHFRKSREIALRLQRMERLRSKANKASEARAA
jgi:hypothetical protein